MSNVEPVSVARDVGHRNRWGMGRFLYRQDGKKLTIERRHITTGAVVVFVLTSLVAIFRGPIQETRDPIGLNGVPTQGTSMEVPMAATQANSRRGGADVKSVQRYSGLEVVNRPFLGKIPPGTIGRARLLSGGSNGPVSAVLTAPVEVNGEAVVELGTKLFGTGSSGEDRLSISFSKFIFRNGTVQAVKAQACDMADQTVGIKGSKVGKHAALLAAGVGLNFAAGLADGLQSTEVRGGVAVRKSDLRNAALGGAAKASIEQSKAMMEEWKQQKSVIEVQPGTDICILFEGD